MEWHTEPPKENVYAIVTESDGIIEAAYFNPISGWISCDTYDSYEIDNVIAWIPMPKPYNPDKGKKVKWK